MLLILPSVLNETTRPPAHPMPVVASDPTRHAYGHPDKVPATPTVPAHAVRVPGV